jgi:hypothetical protein
VIYAVFPELNRLEIKSLISGFASSKPLVRPKRFWAPVIFFFAVLLAVLSSDMAAGNDDSAASEYEVKAAYVYNFAKFIDWPKNVFPAKSDPIIIGIVGDDSFGLLLEKVVKDKAIQEHTLQVRLLKWSADFRTCHIIYIGSSEQKRFRQIIESLRESPVLTITETDEKSQAKGILNLFVDGGKVQFEVNIAEAEKARLRISSKLLRLARGTVGSYSGKGK